MSKISGYAADGTPDDQFEMIGTDPVNTSMAASGTTQTVTPLALLNDQAPARICGLRGASGITALQAAIANRNNARCDIAVIGDSWTEGRGASAFGNTWVQQANRAIRAAYPTTANGSSGGLGFIPVLNTGTLAFTWPIAVASGSPVVTDIGPVRYAQAFFGAGSFTWTAPAGTSSVKIMYYCDNSFSQFSYKINAGGATTVTVSGTVADGTLTASIPITSGQVLTIAWVSGGVFIEGLIHCAGDESSGITLHGCGHQGWNAGTGANGWNQTESFGINWGASYGAFSPAAVVVMLGINDANPTNGNETGPQFQAALTALAGTTLRGETALASVPFLFGFAPAPNESYADAGGWPAYGAATRSVAAALAGSPQGTGVIDLNYRMPSAVSAWKSNALYNPADSYHPTNLGHALIGEIVAAGIRIA